MAERTPFQGETMHTVTPKISKSNMDKIKKELGVYFTQLHQIKGDYYGYFTTDSKFQFSTWKDAFLNMFDMILKDGKNRNIQLPYERYHKVLQEKSCYLEEVTTPVLVDYDMWPGNIFVKKVGEEYEIEGILDFERAFWGDAFADFPTAFVTTDDIRKEKVFLDSYLQASIDRKVYTKEDDIRFQLYRLYIFTIMAVETYRYNFLYAKFQLSFSKSVALKCLKKLEKL